MTRTPLSEIPLPQPTEGQLGIIQNILKNERFFHTRKHVVQIRLTPTHGKLTHGILREPPVGGETQTLMTLIEEANGGSVGACDLHNLVERVIQDLLPAGRGLSGPVRAYSADRSRVFSAILCSSSP